jgi:CheY-like chemotaxis protein
MLTHLGHSVAEAADADEAFNLLGQRGFDVLITDVALPGLAGDELARQAVAQNPGLRVVFASGYDALPERAARAGFTGAVMLRKPYDEGKLADALEAADKVGDSTGSMR